MPEVLVHILIPLMVLLYLRFELKYALAYSLFAILPDFDIFFGVHRSLSHSIVFILIIFLPIIVVAQLKSRVLFKRIAVVLFVLLSHIILDVFTGYTPIFYPLYNMAIYLIVNVTVNTISYNIKLDFNVYTKQVTFQIENVDAPILTNVGIALGIFIFVSIILRKLSRIY